MNLEILHETNDWLVISKPAFMHSVGGKTSGSVSEEIAKLRPELSSLPESGLLHRLDFETSGCLLVAKNLKAYEDLKEKVRNSKEIKKTYLCATTKQVDRTEMSFYFHSRYSGSKKISVLEEGKPNERGSLKCKEIHFHRPYRLYQVELMGPGKRHQIRASFAYCGAPLLGDRLYGSTDNFEGIALHSWSLTLGQKEIQCPLPASWKSFQSLI